MGLDDSDCTDDAGHEWVTAYVVSARGTMDELQTCVRCGGEAYAAAPEEFRPPL